MSNESPPVPSAQFAQLSAYLSSAEGLAEFAAFMAAKAGIPAIEKPKVPELWRRYESHGTTPTDGGRTRIKSWDTGPRYHARYLLEYFGAYAWDEITHELSDGYRRFRAGHIVKATGKPPVTATVNRELRSLQSCFSFAVKKRIIPRNPLMGMTNDPVVHQRDFAITMDQFGEILKHSKPILRSFIMMLCETGCRRDEIRTLEWTEVDLERGFITILAHKAKNGRERVAALTALSRWVLENQPRDLVNPHVFPNTNRPTGGLCKVSLWRWFKEAREASGVTGPKGQEVWMHTLRHSWATDHATAGMPIPTLMALGGWTGVEVMQKYINVADTHKNDAKVTMDERSASLLAKVEQPGARRAAKRTATSSEVRRAPPIVAPKKAKG